MSATAVAQQVCARQQTHTQTEARIDTLIAQMSLAERVAQLQDRAPGIPRLGLPAYNWWNEGLHGIARNGYATVFPQAIGLAATWDADLLHQVGDTVSTEARAKYNERGRGDSPRYGGLTVWSPNINIFRDPRWGRGQETYGEDPFLTAALGTQFVRGIQGDDPFYRKADATPKHFVAHSGPEEGRDSFNTVVSAHDLEDTYLPAFHTLLTEAHATALMCSYNAINGTPSCANAPLLEDTVRGKWGFRGYVVSDCDAVGNLTDYQHFTADKEHGAAAALKAGVDLDCGKSYAPLVQAVADGLVSQAAVDRALHRLLRARLELGLLNDAGCSPYDAIGADQLDSEAHRQLALRAAEESAVLLKNDGTLPLKPGAAHIAVIGPTADMVRVLEANYHGTASHPVTPLDGLSQAFPGITYAQGSLLATGVTAPVPRTALRQGPEKNAAQGLKAEYFTGTSFDGLPSLTRTAAKVDLDVDRAGPDPGLRAKTFAARWSGYLLPPAAGQYQLRVHVERCWDCTTHDRYTLLIDGKAIVTGDGSDAASDHASVRFTDTQPHAVRLEWIHNSPDEALALEWAPPAEALLEEAVATARNADAIVAYVGLSPDLEGEALQVHLAGFAGGDRTSLQLPETQRTLLQRLGALHKPMVLVLTSGSAVALGDAGRQANAVVAAWYPGEEGGHAIANLLTDRTNFSGRLPVTFYRSADDLPAFSDYSMPHRTYRYFDGPVEYPFGFGLSYARFEYGTVKLSKSHVAAGEAVTASVTLRNIGKVAGSEVAELYLSPSALPGAPLRALRGVQRVTLAAGEQRTLVFPLDAVALSFVDADGQRSVRAGEYSIHVGGAQPAAPGDGTKLTIMGEQRLPF